MTNNKLDILTVTDSEVVFNGFSLLTKSEITIKDFAGGLVIMPGKLSPLGNRHFFTVSEHKSSDPELINLIKSHTSASSTVFIEKEGAYFQTNIPLE